MDLELEFLYLCKDVNFIAKIVLILRHGDLMVEKNSPMKL